MRKIISMILVIALALGSLLQVAAAEDLEMLSMDLLDELEVSGGQAEDEVVLLDLSEETEPETIEEIALELTDEPEEPAIIDVNYEAVPEEQTEDGDEQFTVVEISPDDLGGEEELEIAVEELAEGEIALTRLSIDQKYAVAGERGFTVRVALEGDAADYAVEYAFIVDGSVEYAVTENYAAAGEYTFDYVPQGYGRYTVRVTVGEEALEASIPVAVNEYETFETWRQSVADVELTGNWGKDLAKIAKSQLGYEENRRNFIIKDDGVKRFYSRYGDWFGASYSDWTVAFVAFCMEYANIPGNAVPFSASISEWTNLLRNADAFRAAGEYAPKAGDLAFLRVDGAASVGIVIKADDGSVTIAGKVDGAVAATEYSLFDRNIVGYGSMSVLAGETPDIVDVETPDIVDVETPDILAIGDEQTVADEAANETIIVGEITDIPEEPEETLEIELEEEIVSDEAMNSSAVLGVWYYRTVEKENVEINVTTDLDAQYLYMYLGETQLAVWEAASSSIDTSAHNKEWHVTYSFEYPGLYQLKYKSSVDGVSLSPEVTADVTIERPPIIEWWYDVGEVGKPVAMHVYTKQDIQAVHIYLGDNQLAVWDASTAGVSVENDDVHLYKEWVGSLTFDEVGTYNLWYKGSNDGVNLSNAYSNVDVPLVVKQPRIVEHYYERGIENEPVGIHITTNLDMMYLYMYLGDDLLATWQAEDCDITEYSTSKTWNLSYTFEYPGVYKVWYKASSDGIDMSNAYSDAPYITVERPLIISVAQQEEAVAGEPVKILVTTNLDVNYLYLMLDDELMRWDYTYENIETWASCKDWTIYYTFEEAGTYDVWYRASKDGVEIENAFSGVPAVIGEKTEETIIDGDVEYVVVEGGVSVSKYNGSDSNVTIPATVEGYSVVAIGASAFENNTSLVSIDLPDTITVIGAKAFKGCINLANMN